MINKIWNWLKTYQAWTIFVIITWIGIFMQLIFKMGNLFSLINLIISFIPFIHLFSKDEEL